MKASELQVGDLLTNCNGYPNIFVKIENGLSHEIDGRNPDRAFSIDVKHLNRWLKDGHIATVHRNGVQIHPASQAEKEVGL